METADFERVNWPHGARLGIALLQPDKWVNRRVETVTFLDNDVAKRHVSVDFNLPTSKPPPWTGSNDLVECVPLTLLEKRTLTSFDLRDETGTALPALTKRQNGWLAWSALVVSADAILGRKPARDVVRDLREIAQQPSPEALEIAGRFDIRGPAHSHQQRQALLAEPAFADLIHDLAQSFVLMAETAWEPGRRRLLKFSYIEPADWQPFQLSMWRERLGWWTTGFEFAVPRVSDPGSYHFEFHVPAGLRATGGVFTANATTTDATVGAAEDQQASVGDVVHLRLETSGPRNFGTAHIDLAPASHGFMRTAATTATAIAILLTIAACAPGRVTKQNPGSLVGLLLALPSLTTTYLVRPGEHTLVSRFLVGPRAALALTGVIGDVTALAVATIQGNALRAVVVVGAVLAWGLAAILIRGNGQP